MKKQIALLIISLIVSCPALAQRMDNQTSSKEEPKFVVQTGQGTANPTQTQDTINPEEVEEDEALPTTITADQKKEINIQAKRQNKGTIRVQTPRERRSFMDALQMLDKKAERQKAMVEGKSDKEIEKAGESVEKPDVNPLNDRDLEKYLFKNIDINERMNKTDEQ